MKLNRMQLRKLIEATILLEADDKKKEKVKDEIDKKFIKGTEEGIKFDLTQSPVKKFFKNHNTVIVKPGFEMEADGSIKGFSPEIDYKFDVFDLNGTKLDNKITFSGEGIKTSPKLSTALFGGDFELGVDIKIPKSDKVKKYRGKILKGVKIGGINLNYTKSF